MRTLVYGGAACGKSELAERLCRQGATGAPLVYLATMEPDGAEVTSRIARHRALRAGSGFTTIECPRDLARVELSPHAHVLLECLGTLVANELYAPPDWHMRPLTDVLDDVLRGVEHLESVAEGLVVVSNDVFRDSVSYSGETQMYVDVLAQANAMLAQRFERVAEVVCGIAIWQKGTGCE